MRLTPRRVLGRYGVELLVVFVGVWLGLLAEGVRETRRDRADEIVSLGRIAEDLEQTARDMSGNLGRAERGANAATGLLGFEPSMVAGDTLRSYLCDLRALSILAARSAEYRSLIGAGRIGIIRDEEIRRGVTEFYEYLPVLAIVHDREARLLDDAMRSIEAHVRVGAGSESSPCITLLGTAEEVLHAPGFGYAVSELRNARSFLMLRYRQVIERSRELAQLALEASGGDDLELGDSAGGS